MIEPEQLCADLLGTPLGVAIVLRVDEEPAAWAFVRRVRERENGSHHSLATV